MLHGILRSTLYVRVRPNRFDVRHLESGREATHISEKPFTTIRLLIGEFLVAESALRAAMKDVRYGVPYLAAPTVVMHPLAMTEGGLSPVEQRVLMEVAEGAGAKRAAVWVGRELNDAEAREKARAA